MGEGGGLMLVRKYTNIKCINPAFLLIDMYVHIVILCY